MNGHSSCKNAKNRGTKSSDISKLGAQAEIILALKNSQPLKPKEICERTTVSSSAFYRNCHVLETKGLLQRIGDKFALWTYVNVPNMWERLVNRMIEAGGHLIELKVNKLRLGEQDSITGWYEKIYDKTIVIEGFLVSKGVKELEEAASFWVPNTFDAGLVTQGDVRDGDRFECQGIKYEIRDCCQVFDGITTYRKANLLSCPVYK